MKIHHRKCWKIVTGLIKEAKHRHYNKQILESCNKVEAVWKICEKETTKYFSEKVTTSGIAYFFSTYFLTVTEGMNNDNTTLTTGDAAKYLTEAILETFPNINLMPITASEIKSIISCHI
jgi:signal recognition particle GTPase